MKFLHRFFAPKAPTPAAVSPGSVNHAATVAALEPWLALRRREAWLPVVEGEGPGPSGEGPSGEIASRISQFGGRPLLRPQEEPPLCQACSRALRLVLQLDGRETPPGSAWTGPRILQFFYCDDCPVAADGWEAFSRSHHLRVLDVSLEGGAGLSSEGQPHWFPAWPVKPIRGWHARRETPHLAEQEAQGLLRTRPIGVARRSGSARETSRRETLACEALRLSLTEVDGWAKDQGGHDLWELIESAEGGAKLGGWPYWVQGPEYPICPRCGTTMVYVFQIDTDGAIPINLGDAGCGHLFHCPAHPTIWAFSWECC